jgi:RNA polymerase sigma factor (sigma-70 family)
MEHTSGPLRPRPGFEHPRNKMSGFSDCNVDTAILARARRGDMKAHEILYRAYGTPVYTLAVRMLQNPAHADDVLQETSIEVIRKIDTVRDQRAFPGWVKRIAVNKCLGHLRSAWHRLAAHSGGADDEGLEQRHGDEGRHSAALGSDMDAERALALLPATTRAVVWLYDVEGYTHQEIGEMMGRTTSFSKSQLSRAHQRLRELLGLEGEGNEPCTRTQNNC